MTYHAEDLAPSTPYTFNPGTLVRETSVEPLRNPMTGEALVFLVLSTSVIDRRNGLLNVEEANNFRSFKRRHKMRVRDLMAA